MNVVLRKTRNQVKVLNNNLVYHIFTCESNELTDVLMQLKREKELYDLDEMFVEDFQIFNNL